MQVIHIHAEHLIHASDRLTVSLSIFCPSIMKYGCIPSGMLDTTLIPIVKTKTGDVTDKNNYRPIAVATSMSKVMELLILSKTECFCRAVANGPVGPAMVGPIIEPVIFFILFLVFFFPELAGIIIEPVILFDILFETEKHSAHSIVHSDDSIFRQFLSIP